MLTARGWPPFGTGTVIGNSNDVQMNELISSGQLDMEARVMPG